jgi:hypothetical protein
MRDVIDGNLYADCMGLARSPIRSAATRLSIIGEPPMVPLVVKRTNRPDMDLMKRR